MSAKDLRSQSSFVPYDLNSKYKIVIQAMKEYRGGEIVNLYYIGSLKHRGEDTISYIEVAKEVSDSKFDLVFLLINKYKVYESKR